MSMRVTTHVVCSYSHAGVKESDQYSVMLKELSTAEFFHDAAKGILDGYREFCRRVSSTC